MTYTTLVSAEQLQALMGSGAPLLVFDCSFELMKPEAGDQQFVEAHIPGAVRANLDQWKALPKARRKQIEEGFSRVFEMTEIERAAAFEAIAGKLSAAEREQMEKAMTAFRTRSPSQRAQVLSGFQKFAGLSAEERQQFMRNAEVWANMKPSDRQKWRETVAKLPPMPPMPPGFNLPPTPPIPRTQIPVKIAETNGNR